MGLHPNQLGAPIDQPSRPTAATSVSATSHSCSRMSASSTGATISPKVLEAIEVADIRQRPRLLLPPSSPGAAGSPMRRRTSISEVPNINRTNDVSISATKVPGRHTFKAGFYWFTRVQGAEPRARQRRHPVPGTDRLRQRHQQPARLRIRLSPTRRSACSRPTPAVKDRRGRTIIYNNIEWYVQDNWKVNDRLTLDYGLRFTHQQPQYDELLQASNFFPDSGAVRNAPALYVPGCPTAPRRASPPAAWRRTR